ncbi:MAG: hypothetical protein P4L58_00210, partial [Candidatus Pacebacteria bacterium]|nr:hypothetical protein [Candidatus Paceibacterota bacterium]
MGYITKLFQDCQTKNRPVGRGRYVINYVPHENNLFRLPVGRLHDGKAIAFRVDGAGKPPH